MCAAADDVAVSSRRSRRRAAGRWREGEMERWRDEEMEKKETAGRRDYRLVYLLSRLVTY
jgi:hypothetical protein